MDNTVVIDHPLIQHKLTYIRDKRTGTKEFRELVREVGALMAFETTRGLPLKEKAIETPLGPTKGKIVSGKKLGVVPILRAGLGMVEGIVGLIPGARVGHIGLYRDPETLQPVEYYCKLPSDLNQRDIIVIDPMLATGGSAAAAIDIIKKKGGKRVSLLVLLAAPEGIEKVHRQFPEVTIFTAAIDERLNEKGYIVPGLGDAGDRLYGTR